MNENRYHPCMSDIIISTAANGFNIFEPNFEGDDDENDG